MVNNFRFELSFKEIYQLEKKLIFCKNNNINKINIPCKGVIKKKFLYETIDFIGNNFNELDVIYHYSLYHQYTQNKDTSYETFQNFIEMCNYYGNKNILLVSGSNKKRNFDVLDLMNNLLDKKNFKTNLGVAYNPYLKKYFNISEERERIQKKISLGLTNSIWLQYGTDLRLLTSELNFLKNSIDNNKINNANLKIKIYGSLFIPSRQFVARFNYRPWKGVYISEKYLNSLDKFFGFTKDLIDFYLEHNIQPLIETDFCSQEKLEKILALLKY